MTRRRKTTYVLIGLLLMLLLFPVYQVNAARATGTVKNRILNVRSSPSTSSSIVCKLSQGTKVTIISETTGTTDGMKWYNVYFAYNGGTSEGYVRADLVNVSGSVSNSTTTNNNTTIASSGTLYVNKASVRVREKATVGSAIVDGLVKGDEVNAIETTTGTDGNKWTKVSFTKNGKSVQGYIRSDLLASTKPAGTTSSTTTNSASNDNGDEILYVSANSVHVRDSASASSDSIAGLQKGAEVKKKSVKTGSDGRQWTKVSFTKDGVKIHGYIRSDLLTSVKPAGSSDNNNTTSTSDGDILYVNASAVRVRKSASDSAEVVANLLKGDQVKQKSTKTGSDGKQWTKVSFTINGEKYQGYIRSDLLSASSISGDQNNTSDSEEYMYVTASAVRVRSNVSESAEVIANLLKGDQVKKKSVKTGADGKEWTKVSFTINGTKYQGYIRSDYLSRTKPSETTTSNTNTTTINANTKTGTIRPAIANVRSSASTSSSLCAKLASGSKVNILSETTGTDGKKWYKISCSYGGNTVEGYVRSDLIN